MRARVQVTPLILCGLIIVVYGLGAVPPLLGWVLRPRARVPGRLGQQISRLVDLGVGSVLTVLCTRRRCQCQRRWGCCANVDVCYVFVWFHHMCVRVFLRQFGL